MYDKKSNVRLRREPKQIKKGSEKKEEEERRKGGESRGKR